jgi:hypothetical protein
VQRKRRAYRFIGEISEDGINTRFDERVKLDVIALSYKRIESLEPQRMA